MLVIMTCCDSHYTNVRESMNHECPTIDMTTEFEKIAEIEFAAHQAKNETLWTINPMDIKGVHDEMVTGLAAAHKDNAKTLQAKLFGALEALGAEGMKAYGEWRKGK